MRGVSGAKPRGGSMLSRGSGVTSRGRGKGARVRGNGAAAGRGRGEIATIQSEGVTDEICEVPESETQSENSPSVKTTVIGSPWSSLVLHHKESSSGVKVPPEQATNSGVTMESQSSGSRVKVHIPQAINGSASTESESTKVHLPQAPHWEWTDDHEQMEENENFLHLLPNKPEEEERVNDVEVVQLLDDDVILKAVEYGESKIAANYVCFGKDKNKKPHKADEETYKNLGFCKQCLYEAYQELEMANKQQNKKREPKKIDLTLDKINDELEKLPKKEREAILKVINEKHRKMGEEFKERLRGVGMGFYPENKNRKVQQFQHNSTLCYYAYGLKCLTLVFDPTSKDLLVIGAPEVLEEVQETAANMKLSKGKQTKFEVGLEFIKKVIKNTPQTPDITVDIQKTASKVWNNAFSQKRKSDDDVENENENDDGIDVAKKMKKNETESDASDHTVEILEGKIISVCEEMSGVIDACKECESTDLDDKGDSKFFCRSLKCSKIVETTDKVLVVVKVTLNNTVNYKGNTIDEALIQLGEKDLMNLLPKENLSMLTAEVLVGGNVGPDWFRFDDPIWKKFSLDVDVA